MIKPIGGQITSQALNDNFSYIASEIEKKFDSINGLTEEVVNLYVDALNGSDAGDGSEARPFRTLQKLADSIPKIINKDRFIYIAPGTYNEDVSFKSISGASLYLTRKGGLVDATSSTGVRVRSITFFDVVGYCRVENIEAINSSQITRDGFIRFSRCAYGTVHKCRATDSSITKPTFVWDGTQGSVNSSYVNNQAMCVRSMNGSSVRVDSTNVHGGTASAIGISVQAADVFFNGDVTWHESATTSLECIQGGRAKQDVTPINLSLSNGWSNYDTGNHRARAVKDDSGNVRLQGLIRPGTIGQGVVAVQLPVGYRPKFNNQIFGQFSSDGTVSKVFVDIGGVLAVENLSGSYLSLAGITFFAGW